MINVLLEPLLTVMFPEDEIDPLGPADALIVQLAVSSDAFVGDKI
jgi:hypothetical protein